MFEFVGPRINPIGGSCPYQCTYCWSRRFVQRFNIKRYKGEPDLRLNVFKKHPWNDIRFVGTMRDLFSPEISDKWIRTCWSLSEENKGVDLYLTKNPQRYVDLIEKPEFTDFFSSDHILFGATIESNRDYPGLSKAPTQSKRLEAMIKLREKVGIMQPLFISVEPILDFDLDIFAEKLAEIRPYAVALGFDNYGCSLPEPTYEKTLRLLEHLEQSCHVYRKTLREAWNQK